MPNLSHKKAAENGPSRKGMSKKALARKRDKAETRTWYVDDLAYKLRHYKEKEDGFLLGLLDDISFLRSDLIAWCEDGK